MKKYFIYNRPVKFIFYFEFDKNNILKFNTEKIHK